VQTNVGMILQDLGDIQTSLNYFLKAMKCNETLVGQDHLLLKAAMYVFLIEKELIYQLSCYRHRLQLVRNVQRGVGLWEEVEIGNWNWPKRNYSILLKVLGNEEKDPRIEESDALLKEFTAKAVEQQSKRMRKINLL
jgi:hypothetical protein